MSSRPNFSSPLTRDLIGVDKGKKKSKKKNPNFEINKAKRAKLQAEDDEEKRLTGLLFGSKGDDVASAWHDDDDEEEDVENGAVIDNSASLFQIDRTGDGEWEGAEDNNAGSSGDDDGDDLSQEGKEEKNTSAWVDEDDENMTISLTKSGRTKKLRSSMEEDEIQGSSYEQKLRERYAATTSATSRIDWASLPQSDKDSDTDSDDEGTTSNLLSSTAPLLSNNRLQPNVLSITRCADANAGHYSNSTVQAVQFHPGSDEDEPLMLTAGLDKTLRFFKINGNEDSEGSQKIHGVHFPNLPIHSAAFLGDSGSVVVSGRRPFFYIYDAVAGKVS